MGALEEKREQTEETHMRVRASHRRDRSGASGGDFQRLPLGFHPLHGEAHQTCRVFQLQLRFEVLAVGLHGLDAQTQVLSDLFGLPPLTEPLEHLQLAVAQTLHG